MAIEQIDPAAVTGGTALIVTLAWYGRQFYLNWMKSRTDVVASSAVEQQIRMLQDQMTEVRAENKELRLAFHQMDLKLHRQQTKLTRTEMLVRQFVGLMREHNIEVPGYMQAELDDLLKPEEKEKPDA